MTDEQRAGWIRRAVTTVILVGAVIAGIYLGPPKGLAFDTEPKVERTVEKVTEENFEEFISQPGKLAVLHAMVDGNPNSEKLAKIIEDLKKNQTFDERVVYGEVDMEEDYALVVDEDAHAVDFEDFAGQLDFYTEGRKLGSLVGETDSLRVESEIRRYLEGLIQRFGQDWLPDVPGMTRASSETPLIKIQPTAQ